MLTEVAGCWETGGGGIDMLGMPAGEGTGRGAGVHTAFVIGGTGAGTWSHLLTSGCGGRGGGGGGGAAIDADIDGHSAGGRGAGEFCKDAVGVDSRELFKLVARGSGGVLIPESPASGTGISNSSTLFFASTFALSVASCSSVPSIICTSSRLFAARSLASRAFCHAFVAISLGRFRFFTSSANRLVSYVWFDRSNLLCKLIGLRVRELRDRGDRGRGLFDLCLRTDLCSLGDRERRALRLLRRDLDLDRDDTLRHRGLRDLDLDTWCRDILKMINNIIINLNSNHFHLRGCSLS